MKKILSIVLTSVLLLQSCMFTTTEVVINTSTIVSVANQFDDIILLIEQNKSSFSMEDWLVLEKSKSDLQEVAIVIQKTGVASVDQLKILRDAIKKVYLEVRSIVSLNLSDFTLVERIELLEFDRKIVLIDTMLIKVEKDPTTANSENLINMMLELSRVVLLILPMVL